MKALSATCLLLGIVGWLTVRVRGDLGVVTGNRRGHRARVHGLLQRVIPLGLPAYVVHQTIVVLLAWPLCTRGLPLAVELPLLVVGSLAVTLGVSVGLARLARLRLVGLSLPSPEARRAETATASR